MDFVNNLIKKIENFFLSVFFSSVDDYQKRKQLKAIENEIKQIKPAIYRNDGVILPGFAVIIFQMYKSVLPLKKLLLNTICSKDIRLSTKYIDKIIEEAFSAEQKEIKENLSVSARRSAVEFCTKPEFEKRLQDQRKIFTSFIKSLQTKKIQDVSSQIEKLLAFFDFLNFNFNKMLTVFDRAFEPYIGKDEIMEVFNFQYADSKIVLNEILDLNFLLSNISIDENLLNGFLMLNASLPEEMRLPDDKIRIYLKELVFVLDKTLGKNTLLNLIRLIKGLPDFEDKTSLAPTKPALEEYIERTTASFQSDTKKLAKLRQDGEMTTLISAVFGNSGLLSFIGYTEEMNARIQALSTFSFDWITPMEVIKTFTVLYFEKIIKPFLREVMVEGYFQDKNFQSALGVSYYYCENLYKKFDDFERLLDVKSPYGLNVINGYLAELEKGGDFKKQLSRILDHINLSAKKLIEESGKHYFELFKYCELLSQDSKKSLPVHVTNIRALSVSLKNKDNFVEFEKNIKKFAGFVEILKNYIILDKINTSDTEHRKILPS